MTSKEHEVRQRRVLRAPRQHVWDAWTNAETMLKWFSPLGLTTEAVEADVVEGGSFRIEMRMPPGMRSIIPDRGGLVVASGRYERLVEPVQLLFSWNWDGHDEISQVEIALTDIGGLGEETELRLTHRLLVTAESQHFHDEGWALTFDHLDELFTKQLKEAP